MENKVVTAEYYSTLKIGAFWTNPVHKKLANFLEIKPK